MRKTTSNSYPDVPIHGEEGDQDRATHNMNYHVLVIFHKDRDNRPCRPVVCVVHLNSRPDAFRTEVITNPRGSPILTTCQLCDPSVNTPEAFSIDHGNILCICTVSITDEEAGTMINNVSKINTRVSRPDIVLTERSNIAIVPLSLHKFIPYGMGSIKKIQTAATVTDVEVAILLIRESVNKARSLYSRLSRLHAAASTPLNMYDALYTFSRQLDINSFKCNAFRYITS
jgi:hypothetical protein